MDNNVQNNTEAKSNEVFKQLILNRDKKIAELTAQVEKLENAVPKESEFGQKYVAARQEMRQMQATFLNRVDELEKQNANLFENVEKGRRDYDNLRVQKGGFGFLAMALVGLAGLFLGWGVQRFLLTKKENHQLVFEKFKNQTQFDFEYKISQGRFDEIEKSLKTSAEKPEFASIKPEIEFFRKTMGATRRKLEEANVPLKPAADGYSIEPTPETINAQQTTKKSLTVTEDEITVRAEASTSSEKLARVKRDAKLGVWDRTNSMDKITTMKDGNKVEITDYWYKIETPDKVEGWVFGHFTSKSLNRVILIGEPVEVPVASPAEATPAVKPAQ